MPLQPVQYGSVTKMERPVHRWGFNESFGIIGEVDADGNCNIFYLNLLHELLGHVLGTTATGIENRILNGLGLLAHLINALGIVIIQRIFNKRDFVIQMISPGDGARPGGYVTTYTPNESNKLIIQQFPSGATNYNGHDCGGNINFTFIPPFPTMPNGQMSFLVFDRNKKILLQTDGAPYPPNLYERDFGGNKSKQTRRDGLEIYTLRNCNQNKIMHTTESSEPALGWPLNGSMIQAAQSGPNVAFIRDEAGPIIEIDDSALDLRSQFILNLNGTRIDVKHSKKSDGSVYLHYNITVIAERPMQFSDGSLVANLLYSGRGYQIGIVVNQGSYSNSVWNVWNQNGLPLIYHGMMLNNQIIVPPWQYLLQNRWALAYGYNRAAQIQDAIGTWWLTPNQQQGCTYFPDGELEQVQYPFCSYGYGPDRNLTWRSRPAPFVAGGQGSQNSFGWYPNGQVCVQTNETTQIGSSVSIITNTTTTSFSKTRMSNGNPTQQETDVVIQNWDYGIQTSQSYNSITTLQYIPLTQILMSYALNSGNGQWSSVSVFYDGNGNECNNQLTNANPNIAQCVQRVAISTAEGELVILYSNNYDPVTRSYTWTTNTYYYFKGAMVAPNNIEGFLSTTDMVYDTQIPSLRNMRRNTTSTFQASLSFAGYNLPISPTENDLEVPAKITLKQAMSFDAISVAYLRTNTEGERLALMNRATRGSDVAQAGRTIELLPRQGIVAQYTANLFPMRDWQQTYMNLWPEMKPPKPIHHHIEWWKLVLETAVAAAVSIAIAGPNAPWFMYVAAGMFGGLAEQMTADALGNGQGVLWNQLLESTIVNALTLGFGNALHILPTAGEAIEEAVDHATGVAVIQQVLSLGLGVEHQLDWQTMVGQILGGVIDSAVGMQNMTTGSKALTDDQELEENLEDNLATNVVDTALAGHQSLLDEVAQILGSTGGDELSPLLPGMTKLHQFERHEMAAWNNANQANTGRAKLPTPFEERLQWMNRTGLSSGAPRQPSDWSETPNTNLGGNGIHDPYSNARLDDEGVNPRQSQQISTQYLSRKPIQALAADALGDAMASSSTTRANITEAQNAAAASRASRWGANTSGGSIPTITAPNNINKWQNLANNPNGLWNQNPSIVPQVTIPTFMQSYGPLLSNTVSFFLNPIGAIVKLGTNALALGGAKLMQDYVAQHGSLSMDLSVGVGVAIDTEIGFSKQGITGFVGLGVGLGIDISAGGNYDFQDTSGFTSKTSANISLDAIPVQFGDSFMVSQSGPAFSLDVQPGEGLEIESVAGYTATASWNEVENSFQRRMRY